MADVVYLYNADVRQILESLNQVDKTNEKVWRKAEKDVDRAIKNILASQRAEEKQNQVLEKEIEKRGRAYLKVAEEAQKVSGGKSSEGAFEKIGTSAQQAGTQIGLVSGIVSSLTTEFIRLGEQAVGVLEEIVKRSVDSAIQMDLLKTKLLGIFSGSQEAADEAFNFIQEKSKETGVDLSELAGAFIPKSESLAQFEKIAKIASVLATQDPLGMDAARIALQEALSGDFVSLRKRFEFVTKADIENIKKLQGELGDTEGLIAGLEKILGRQGLAFENLQNTAQVSFDKLAIAGQQLGGRLGQPIVQALEEASNKILSFLNENEDDLIVFADTIGRAIADVINFISGIDLSQLDTNQLIEFADYVFRVVNAVELAIQQFQLLYNSVSPLFNVFGSLGLTGITLTDVFTNIDDALVTASQILALATASFEALKAALDAVIAPFESLVTAIDALNRGDVSTAAAALTQAYDELQTALYDTSIVQNAFNKSIQESQASFSAYDKAAQDNKTAQDDLRDSLQKQKDAGTGAADAILQKAQADRQAAEDADKLKEAQDKVNKAMAEAEKDFQRKLEDIDTAYERKRLDIVLEFAQKREDAAKKNLEKLSDIRKKNGQEIQDAESDLSRKEEDIARKYSESRLDLERETRQKRVDIETDYRRKLQDIQAQFLLDADEAEQKRDAIAFLKALKDRDTKVQQAQTDRQRTIDDARATEEQKRQELAIQRQREIEEAQIDNERKLEDLKISLERQIEEQNTAYARELEDLQVQEQRKFEEAQVARERDIEDAKKAYDRKLEDLQTSLADELAVLKEGNAKLEEEAQRHAAAMTEAEAAVSAAGGPISQQSGFVQNRMNLDKTLDKIKDMQQAAGRTVRLGGRAGGGPVIKGMPYVTHDKELFVPNENGMIIPKQRLMSILGSQSTVSNYSSSQNQQINIPMATAGQLLDPIFVAQLRNIIKSELSKVY